MTAFTREASGDWGKKRKRDLNALWRRSAVFSLATFFCCWFSRSSFRFRFCTGVCRRRLPILLASFGVAYVQQGADVAGRRVGGVCGVHLRVFLFSERLAQYNGMVVHEFVPVKPGPGCL